MNVAWMPSLNAGLNATSAVLLMAGFCCIRAKKIAAHKRLMVSALVVSATFLVSYLFYHAHVGSVHFAGSGWVRPVYFTILISHTVLAIVIVPLALRTVFLAGRSRFGEHMAIARWTLPVWLYVSVTGVIVYWMLYQWKS